MPVSKPAQEVTTEFDMLPALSRPFIKAMVATYQGNLVVLTSDGRMFERVTDPSPRTTPGAPGKIWQEIEPPKV